MVLSSSPARMVREPLFGCNSRPWCAMHNLRLLPVTLLLMASSACWFRKSPPAFTPPPPPQAQATTPEPPTLPAPPKIEGDPAATAPPETSASLPPAPEPPKPKRSRRESTASAPPKAAAPAPASAPETPPPKLGQIFTPDQLREYNRILDESLERVRKALAILAGKNLNPEQSEIANRIRTFQKQAEQARE